MEYLPFGETLVEEHINSNNSPFRFNAKELDEETGNYYYGARYYDPKWSIWLSVDPLAEQMPEWSSYAYTFNNPVRYTDPTGMIGEDWVYDKENKKYIWKEEVESPEDIKDKERYEYVGLSKNNIKEHYDNNTNFIEKLLGFFQPEVDHKSFNNYLNKEINKRIEDALNSYYSTEIKKIDMNIRGLKENNNNATNKNQHSFILDIKLDDKRIKGFNGYYTERTNSKNNNLISLSVFEQKFNGKSSGYNYPVKILFYSTGHRNEAIIDINVSEKAKNFIDDYLTKKHYENKN